MCFKIKIVSLFSIVLIPGFFLSINADLTNDNKSVAVSNVAKSFWTERLSVFNEWKLLTHWDFRNFNVSFQCNTDMVNYLNSLHNESAWAIRMKDASGQYDGGLFWGNDYWLGSAALCKKLDEGSVNYQKDINVNSEPLKDPEFIITFEKRTIYKTNPYAKFTLPPFKLMFSTVLFRMNVSDAQSKGLFFITQGLCLPRSCNEMDIRKIFTFSANIDQKVLSRSVNIIKVRQLNGKYSLWNDKIFQTLCGIILAVIICVISGTIVDLKLRKLKKLRTLNIISTVESNNNIENSNLCKKEFNKIEEITIQNLNSSSKENSENGQRMATRILLSFSLLTNVKKICSADIGDDTLAPLHGMRLVSFIWVVMVHTCLIIFQMADNKKFRNEIETDVLYQTISNATFSVDTFFFISGVLVSFLFYRTTSKYSTKQLIHTDGFKAQLFMYFSLILYRFVRLTPPYLFVIGLSSISTKYHITNSVIMLPSLDHINCERYWWRNILYINTFFPSQQMCMIWSWYLANDSQFYAIGIIVLLLSVRHLKFAAAAIGTLIVFAWITTAAITVKTGYIPNIADPFSHYDELYDKPWTRFGPYFVGIISGYVLYQTNCKFPMNRWISAVCWSTAVIIILITLYGLYYISFDIYSAALYVSLSHTFWAVAIAWILFACVSGYGGWVTKILCWKYIYPFSRLAYCAYLIHPVIIKNVLLNVESPLHITKEVVTIFFLGFLVASFFVAFLISVLFEAPIVSLLHFTHPMKKTAADEKESHENKGYNNSE